MKRACKSRINDRGFTMIEIVMVLIVMAVVGTFILSGATTTDNELMNQAEILKSHLRHAQIKAMSDTEPWGIHIPNAGSYILYRKNAVAKDNAGNDIMLPGATPGVPPAPQTYTLPAAVTITGGTGVTYNFNDWGKPVDTGTPPADIGTVQTITLTQGSRTAVVTITKNTGYIP